MEEFDNETIKNTGLKEIPEWINEKLFQEFLEKDFPKFHKIMKFIVKPAVSTGENYMTVMLRIIIELELDNGSITTTSYMAKIQPTPERMQLMIKEWKVFVKEHTTYTKYIPVYESYYQKAGCNINLAPRLLDPTKCSIKDDVLILEDLRPKGFRNFNRHLGLDLKHTKAVLQKLSQLHAASAHHFRNAGPYPKIYDKCLSTDVDLYKEHRLKVGEIFRENLNLYGNFKWMEEKLKVYSETQPNAFHLESDWKTNKFNVLNHGDCWTNNIMFQYDKDDQLMETLLIDFQMSRFGSPAQDLYYFLLSSTNLEVKVKYFDYFISYYHQELIRHLKLLQYEGKIPSLKDLQLELLKHDYWAYLVITTIMPIILCESRDDANVESLLDEDDDSLKRSMYRNDLYVRNVHTLLPWLDNRGAFEV